VHAQNRPLGKIWEVFHIILSSRFLIYDIMHSRVIRVISLEVTMTRNVLSECVESSSLLTVTFDGNNEIDVDLLLRSIKSYVAILQNTAAKTCPEAYLRIRVTPFQKGSFELGLSALIVGLLPVLPNVINTAKTICDFILGYFKIKECLKGEKPKKVKEENGSITITGDDNTVTVSGDTYQFYQMPEINGEVAAIFGALAADGTRQGLSIKTENEVLQIPESSFVGMSKMEVPSDAIFRLDETTSKVEVFVKKPDLMGNSKWGFYDGKNIDATVEDEAFLAAVRRGDIQFISGDKILVELKTIFILGDDNLPLPGSEKYIVTRVFGHPKHRNVKLYDQIEISNE
jgi:hypothetical protein